MEPFIDYKTGYVTIIGRPNVGKSTLINRVLDIKLSITTPKAQTTRRKIMGILNRENLQIIFLDTPGLLEPRYELHKAMLKNVRNAILDTDLLLFMIEVSSNRDMEYNAALDIELLKEYNNRNLPVLLVINKIDKYPKELILPMIDQYRNLYPFNEIIPVSALKFDGIDRLLTVLKEYLPNHPPFYDPEILTDFPERFFVGELIREQVFYQFQEEVPYSAEVVIENFKERDKGKDFISAVIVVERSSQKSILIGKNGQALKKLGSRARHSIETFLGREVFLELKITVRKDWRKDDLQLKKLGY